MDCKSPLVRNHKEDIPAQADRHGTRIAPRCKLRDMSKRWEGMWSCGVRTPPWPLGMGNGVRANHLLLCGVISALQEALAAKWGPDLEEELTTGTLALSDLNSRASFKAVGLRWPHLSSEPFHVECLPRSFPHRRGRHGVKMAAGKVAKGFRCASFRAELPRIAWPGIHLDILVFMSLQCGESAGALMYIMLMS